MSLGGLVCLFESGQARIGALEEGARGVILDDMTVFEDQDAVEAERGIDVV